MVMQEQQIHWHKAYRIIASRFPPIDLFERLGNREVQEALIAAEMLTNPRLRQQAGEISLIPEQRRVYGVGATYVMASFAYPKPSRFSDGSFGVYYAGSSFATALHETVYHFCQYAADSGDGRRYEDQRVLIGEVDNDFIDVRQCSKAEREKLLDANSYLHSQPFALKHRECDSNGIHFPSVRHKTGLCIGAFWPDTIGIPRQAAHIQYHYDGERVCQYFDYSTEKWVDIAV